MAGLFPALGNPMHIVQIAGGSAQPSQMETHRAFPMVDPTTDNNAAKT
jgi:hypothetical protein